MQRQAASANRGEGEGEGSQGLSPLAAAWGPPGCGGALGTYLGRAAGHVGIGVFRLGKVVRGTQAARVRQLV